MFLRGMRSVFVRVALATFAGFAVLGLVTAVTPDFLGQDLGVTNRAAVGLVVFSVFAASTAGQAMLTLLVRRPSAAHGLCRTDRRHGVAGAQPGCVVTRADFVSRA